MPVAPSGRRIVVAGRPTEWELLVARHGTPGQVKFFLETRGRDVDDVVERHHLHEAAVAAVERAIPTSWRRVRIRRAEMPTFLFEPDDIVIAVGQDGLVPNLAKYIDDQPVIGVNPDPLRYEGLLVRHGVGAVGEVLEATVLNRSEIESRTMVQASTDDGQTVVALNEVFVGHRSHQSARYTLLCGADEERQSSSGVVVATGTGATGWARSIDRERHRHVDMPAPVEDRLVYFAREAWPSVSTGATITHGSLDRGRNLTIVSEMEDGVVFGDGMESDAIGFGWGQALVVEIAARRLRLVA